MERVVIVSADNIAICKYLDAELTGLTLEGFNNISHIYSRVESAPLRCDAILFTDSAFYDKDTILENVSESGTLLLKILQNPLFTTKKMIFLDSPDKHKNINDMVHYIKSLVDGVQIEIKEKESFTIEDVKSALIEFTGSFLDVKGDYKYVVRKGRQESIDTYILPGLSTDRVLVADYATLNVEKDNIKNQLKDITDGESLEELVSGNSLIDALDVELPKWLEVYNTGANKYIGVMGESKSGASIMSLVLGASASALDKTLLVDMNFNNLGLSYLVDKTVEPEDVNQVFISDIISRTDRKFSGIEELTTESMKKERLHILSLDLTLTDNVSLEDYAFFVVNILSTIEKAYRFIIFDLPAQNAMQLKTILNKLDKLILCTPPYMNNIVSLLTAIDNGELLDTKIFNSINIGKELQDVIMVRTGVFQIVPKNIKAISTRKVHEKSSIIIDRTMPVTGVYQFRKYYNDLDFFKQLILI